MGYVIIPVWVFYLIKDRPALEAAESSLPPRRPDLAVADSSTGCSASGSAGSCSSASSSDRDVHRADDPSVVVDPVFGRYAVLLSGIAGVLELLPIIGPIIAAIPAVLLALTAGIEPAIAALLLYLLIQQVENNVLVPKIQGDAVELHPSIVMLALVVGGWSQGCSARSSPCRSPPRARDVPLRLPPRRRPPDA